MKLSLHIGMLGAGADEIQAFLEHQGEALSPLTNEMGYNDLMMLGGTDSALNEVARRYGTITPQRVENLRSRLKSSPLDHIVLSGRGLYEIADSNFVGQLCLELSDIFDEMQVVIYLRDQVEHFHNLLMDRIKLGYKNWASALKVPTHLYKYDENCALWEQDIDIVVRDYGRCRDNVVFDFCKTVGLPVPKPLKNDDPTQILDKRAMHLMLLINACADPSHDGVRRRIYRELCENPIENERFNLSDQLQSEIRELSGAGNKYVSETYLSGVPFAVVE